MTAPGWACAVLRRLAPPDEAEVLIGDLEEAHRQRVSRRGRLAATLLTSLETADIAFMLVRRRPPGSVTVIGTVPGASALR